EPGPRLRPSELRDLAPVDAFELGVEPRPAGDAVDVLHVRAPREPVELVPRELDLVLHLSEDAERPGRQVAVARDVARMQHGPLLRQVLPGWKPRGVVPELA